MAVAKLQALSAQVVGELKGCGQTWGVSAAAGQGGGVQGGDDLFLAQGVLQSPLVYSLLQMKQQETSLVLLFGRRESILLRNPRAITVGCFVLRYLG